MTKANDHRTIIIVQARMTSSRLPGKVLKEVLGKPLLAYQLERLLSSRKADDIVLATTVNLTDQPLVDFCRSRGISFYRGSEQDVLARYYEAACGHDADVIVRVTSDCPLIDPRVVDRVIADYREGGADYVANIIERSYPRGMDCEVFSFEALAAAYREAAERPEREHVTPFIHRQPARFRLRNVAYSEDQSRHRWTVDTLDDFELMRCMLEALAGKMPDFTLEDCLALIDENPEWEKINWHVEQKTYGE
ncbi:NTP transferase domain-containing protein [candidate division GN15 bacterium]|nr:NTP transferase domain-containing protein [candidate division GN15 bacterium]